MMVRLIMFVDIVGQLFCSWFQKQVVVALLYSILYPIELYIHCFGPFFWVVVFDIPSMVELSVCVVVACCWWPI